MNNQPKQTFTEAEQKAACAVIIERAAVMIFEGVGAPIPLILDRMLHYVAAQACTLSGSPQTAEDFRAFADLIEAGRFHSVTLEDQPNKRRQ